ncbi:hypothetical protein [Halosimplex amylolyticum]|uniref:hypothetical protein n=1 Tax=Halosimplex amylolyticum TaxID=3396616 RepID=UPI003F554E9C
MTPRLRTVFGVLALAALVVCAGCGEPGGAVTEAGDDETATTDNDAGAEPIAPNGTESERTATGEPTATRTTQSSVGGVAVGGGV